MTSRQTTLGDLKEKQSSEQRSESLRLKREHMRSQLTIGFEEYEQHWDEFAELFLDYEATEKEFYEHKLNLLLQVHPKYYSSPQPGAHFWSRSGLNEAALADICDIMTSRHACAQNKRFIRYWCWYS